MKKGLYTRLPKYCKEMTRLELLEYFPEGTELKEVKSGVFKEVPKYTVAYLMRSLIMNERQHCNKFEIRTLRGVWYSAIKPTLDKLGLLEDKDSQEDELKRWDAKLSNYVCDLLRRGELTFSDLGIQDISRQKSNPAEAWYNTGGNAYSYQGRVAPYPNILIATEKDTVYSIISDIADLYGCSSISCKGQNSLGAMELIVKGMFSRRYDDLEEFDTIYILTMTDYDPAGYYIAEALYKQVRDILTAIGREYIDVSIHRIGITPDQLSREEVLQNMYSPKKNNIDKWMRRTGGIDGQEKGLELDAFSTNQIREIFVNNLKDFIDDKHYKTFVKTSYIKKMFLESIVDRVNNAVEKLTDEVIDDLELKDFDIHEFALKGRRSIYIEDLCENDNDDLIAKLSNEYL